MLQAIIICFWQLQTCRSA